MAKIIDVAQNVVGKLSLLKESGIEAIIRYDCRLTGGRWKEASNAEIEAILKAGLEVGIVNEGIGNNLGAFDYDSGYADASYSLARANARNQSENSAIYYAIDFDVSYGGVQNHIIPYFKGVDKAHSENHKHWRKGAYCSGMCAGELVKAKLIDLAWITCSGGFQGSRAYVNADAEDLWQYRCEIMLHGLDVDYNIYPAHKGDWGQWKMGAVPAPSPAPPQPSPKFVQTGKASWYDDNTNADGSPVSNDSDMTCAHRTLKFGTLLKVTRLDTGAFCVVRVSDRGPYAAGRIIDLRPAAAKALNMIEAGVVSVKIEEIVSV
jgi:hypothetical protein